MTPINFKTLRALFEKNGVDLLFSTSFTTTLGRMSRDTWKIKELSWDSAPHFPAIAPADYHLFRPLRHSYEKETKGEGA